MFLSFLCFLILPYFRGNSLNSRADLELKEIRRFFHNDFSKKNEIQCFFSKNHRGKKETIRIFWKNIEFHFFLNNHRGKSRISFKK